MVPRRRRGRRAQLAASTQRAMSTRLQEPHFPSWEEGAAPQGPMTGTPPTSSGPVLKEEGNGEWAARDLFSFPKEREEETEETAEVEAFPAAPLTSAQPAAKQSCRAESCAVLSCLKEENEEEEAAATTSSSPAHDFPPPATPPILPSHTPPPVIGRKFHPDGGLEMLQFFTPFTHFAATSSSSKRGCERDALMAGMDTGAPPLPKKTTSAVWDYFTLDPREPCVAVCSACQKRVRRGKDGGTRPGTTALHKHLKVHHGIHLPGVAVVPPSPLLPPKEKPHGNSTVAAEAIPAFQLTRQERSQMYFPPTHPTAIQLASDTTWMLAVDMQPFSYVESEGFRRLIAMAQPCWRVPSRVFFSTKAMPELSDALSRVVRQAVACSVSHTVHIAVELWSGSRTAHFMSVTGCWVAESGGTLSRQHATLSVCAIEETCLKDDICQKLRDIMQDWLCDLKTGVVVSNNSTYVARAARELHLKHIPCLTHCLKVAVKSLTANHQVAQLLTKSRHICSYYSHVAAARHRLLEAQASLGPQQPMWEGQARDNSTLRMLEGLLRQWQAIGAMWGQDEDTFRVDLTMADWKLAKCLVEILKPFEDATSLVMRPGATLCQALPLLWFLEEQLRALRTRFYQENNSTGALLTTQALDHLVGDSQLCKIKSSMVCRVAAFLDPRFRDITTMKLGGADTADATLLREYIVYLATRSYVPPRLDAAFSQASRLSPQQPSASSSPPGSAAWQITMKRWRAITKNDPATGLTSERGAAVALREVEEYIRDNVDHIGENADPMLYWQEKMGAWPALFKVAVFHFGCPPTSVPIEDLAKTASSTLAASDYKNLSPAEVKMFTFIRRNRHLLPADWKLSTGDLSSSQNGLGTGEDVFTEEEEDLLTMDDEGWEEELE